MTSSEASFWSEIQRQCDEEDAIAAGAAASRSSSTGPAAAAAAGSPAEHLAVISPPVAGATNRAGDGRTGPERTAFYQRALGEPSRSRRRTPNSAFQPWGRTIFRPPPAEVTPPTPPPQAPLTLVQRRRAEAAAAAASAGAGASSSSVCGGCHSDSGITPGSIAVSRSQHS